MKRLIASAASVSILFPMYASAAVSEVLNIWSGATCGGSSPITSGGPPGPCDFCDMLHVASNIIQFMLYAAVAVSVAMIVIGGLTMITSVGNESRFTEGKGKITAALGALAVAIGAWAIVNTVLTFLSGNPSFPWSSITC
jgi:hypothetical protein